MENNSQKAIFGEVTLGQKASEKFAHFVPGESVSGTVFARVPKPIAFKHIHVEFVGRIDLKNKYNPNAKKPKEIEANKDRMLQKVVARSGFTYDYKYGNDTSRSITFPFHFVLANDIPPSMVWKNNESKPNAVCECKIWYEFFLWIDIDGVGRNIDVEEIPKTQMSNVIDFQVTSQIVSDMVGAQAPNGVDNEKRIREHSVKYESKVGTTEVTLKCPDPCCIFPSVLDVSVHVSNGNRKKEVKGLIFCLEEVVRVSIGNKEECYRRIIQKDRPNAPFNCQKSSDQSIKHKFELTLPRGLDVGCIQNNCLKSDHISIIHELSVSAMMSGVKEKDLTAMIPIFVSTAPPERKGKEYKF